MKIQNTPLPAAKIWLQNVQGRFCGDLQNRTEDNFQKVLDKTSQFFGNISAAYGNGFFDRAYGAYISESNGSELYFIDLRRDQDWLRASDELAFCHVTGTVYDVSGLEKGIPNDGSEMLYSPQEGSFVVHCYSYPNELNPLSIIAINGICLSVMAGCVGYTAYRACKELFGSRVATPPEQPKVEAHIEPPSDLSIRA